MAQVEVILPKMGESVAEATIIKWLKSVGDKIEADESIVEIATDKVDSEVPSPVSGVISEIKYNAGQTVQVGHVMAIIATEANANGGHSREIAQNQQSVIVKPPAPPLQTKTETSVRFYSPLVRKIAREEGIAIKDLESIEGHGKNRRVTKQDIMEYIKASPKPQQQSPKPQEQSSKPQEQSPKPQEQPAIFVSGKDEIIEMDRMRRLIADHMVMSKHTSPHVTSFVEADVTNIVLWRERIKNIFEKREGEKFTFTPIFIEALVKAIKDFPMINIRVEGSNIIVKKEINIGMAAALPSGNLIVPVIKNADRLSLYGIAKTVNDLAARARSNKLMPDEIQGGTYTLTNVGVFGNVMGTPIINQPQVAILATGAIKKKPAVIETSHGDTIGIRHMMFLSHSYDHRVVDGALGGSFVRKVADYLEQFDMNREI